MDNKIYIKNIKDAALFNQEDGQLIMDLKNASLTVEKEDVHIDKWYDLKWKNKHKDILFECWWAVVVEDCWKRRCLIPQDEEMLISYRLMLKEKYLKRYSCSCCAFQNYDEGCRGHGGGTYCILNPDFHYKNKGKNIICNHYADDIAQRYKYISGYLKYYTKVYKKFLKWFYEVKIDRYKN